MIRSKIKFEQITDYYNCVCAIKNAIRNKQKVKFINGKAVKVKLYRYIDNIDFYAKELQKFLTNVLNGTENFHQGNIVTINDDGTRNKTRELCKPKFFPDQCGHWAIILVVAPVLEKCFYKYSCASIPGRGTHCAKDYLQGFLKDKKNTKYCLQLDIKGFYKNIDKNLLVAKLKNKIKDKRIIKLLENIIYSYTLSGLPLGYYTSAILANFYLTGLDQFIKESVHASYYTRYMDDIVILGSNKRKLHRDKKLIEKHLQEKLSSIKLKGNWQVYKLPYKEKKGRAIDFVGFRFFKYKTTLRKSIFSRMVRLLKKISSGAYTLKNAYRFFSYRGYIKHTNSENIQRKYINHKIGTKRLKEIIRNESRGKDLLRREAIGI